MESAACPAHIFRFGLFEADASCNSLTRGGVRVKIQEQPFRVLIALLERPAEVVTREELRQKLWPEGTFVDFDGSLNVILKKLRAAINDDSENPRFIETIPRRGYRFIAPVSITGKSEPHVAQKISVSNGPDIEATPGPIGIAAQSRPGYHLIYVGVCALLLLAIGTVFLVWHGKQVSAGESFSADSAKSTRVALRKSVAVLGFHSNSGKVGDAWLAMALSEMLSTELAGGGKLRLVSGEEVANLRLSSPWSQTDTLDRATTARIGNALNSDVLVLGSYMTMGQQERGQVRLDVRLQDAKTGEILSEIAEIGGAQDLFHLVSRVGDELRQRLGVDGLNDPDQAGVLASVPMNREAARFYSLGLAKLRQFDALAAKDLLQQACIADPKFSLAHLMLGRAWAQLGYEQNRREEAKKALDLSSDLPKTEQLLVQGDYYESLADHEKASSTYSVLYQLFPDSVEYGLLLANAQISAGHASLAAETISQLRKLPAPASDDPLIDLSDIRASATKDPDRMALIRSAMRKAEAQGKKLVYARALKEECMNLNYSEHPEQATPACEDAYNIYISAGNRLGAADAVRLMADNQGRRGHIEQAIATYQKALAILTQLGEHEKTGAVLNNMAINFANEGKLDRAEQLYRQAKFHFEQAGDKGNSATALTNIADILYLRGDLGGAEKLFEQAFAMENSLDHPSTAYLLYRAADLKLTQGEVKDAHRLAQQSVDAYRASQDGYQYLTAALTELGEVLSAEGDLNGARQQFQIARDMGQKAGDAGVVAQSDAELADIDLEQNEADKAEPLIRSAIAEFEQEKSDPASSAGYTNLSRVLLMQGKVAEAGKAVQRGIELSLTSSDPALKLPAAIQHARVEMASGGPNSQSAARLELRSTIATAKKLGYYRLEAEARLLLGESETKTNPTLGHSQLNALASETRSRGLEAFARQAEEAISNSGTIVAANKSLR